MNTKNNSRMRETERKIISAVFEMITKEKMPIGKITVREICERTGVHRSTFYAHYQDVYDLVEKVERTMANQLTTSFIAKLDAHASSEECFVELFRFVREYREFYAYYLNETNNNGVLRLAWDVIDERYHELNLTSLGLKNMREMEYHGAFVVFGLTAMVHMWVEDGCKESPEELYALLRKQSEVLKHTIEWTGQEG